MGNISSVIKNIRNIMRKDRGASGDAARIEQIGWMLFLKILDDKDQELEILHDEYESVIPEKFQWRNWASNPEGMTGDELLEFIDSTQQDNPGLFLSLKSLTSTSNSKRASIVKEVFDGTNNYMKSGYAMRKAINELNKIDFNSSEHKHAFGDIYESILVELRDASTKGEFYTPRAVTELMTKMIDPKLGEGVLDPAAGTGGFLTAAIDHIRENYVHTVDDEHIVQDSVEGWELKPVAYVLGLTNLILHGIDVPNYEYVDSLKKEYSSIGPKDQVDVILANPPFGGTIDDGVETNFPASYRCKESADLFVILMLKLLKPGGRCAIVLPDGCISGDGVKERIREKLLTDCNLHTIIRLPKSTFFPATVSTNLLFFEKGTPTQKIWYYEHRLPEGQKSYSKTKPIKFNEFKPIIDWWNNREKNELAWSVDIDDLKGFDLDIKNPSIKNVEISYSSEDIFLELDNTEKKLSKKIASFKKYLGELKEAYLQLQKNNQNSFNFNIEEKIKNISIEVENQKVLSSRIKQSFLQESFEGKLTKEWRKKILSNSSKLENYIKVDDQNLNLKIPKSWNWTYISEIADLSTGNSINKSLKDIKYSKTSEGLDYIGTKDVHFNFEGIHYDTGVKIPDDELRSKFKVAKPSSILVCIEGGSSGKKIAMTDRNICYGNKLLAVQPNDISISPYLFYLFQSPHFKKEFDLNRKGLRGGVSISSFKKIRVPLPPSDEIQIIVKKINSIFK